jgi:DNA excision repair protein ERCC-2
VVGDYNYYFDGSAMLHTMTLAHEWRVGLLADEAHNLVERARSMYSASLAQSALRALRATAPAALRPALDKLHRAFSGVRKAQAAAGGTLDALPASFVSTLRQASQAMEAQLAEAAPGVVDGPLQQFHFDVLAFLRLAESFGSHSVLELAEQGGTARQPATTVRIQNLIPAPFLKPRFAGVRTATLFSATLSPPRYFMDMLGAPADTAWIDVASPFRPEQLQVHVVSSISTRYADRQRSAGPIADVIAQQFAARPGNYLAFFSSFEYLDLVASEFRQRHPDVPTWAQARGMDEGERQAFLARFVPQGPASVSRSWAAVSAKGSTCAATAWSAPSWPPSDCRR